jgi:hypothetical protein
VETLVQLEPAAVRMADKYGQFPLHKAAIKPKADPGIVTVLLDAAAEVATMKDLNGYANSDRCSVTVTAVFL